MSMRWVLGVGVIVLAVWAGHATATAWRTRAVETPPTPVVFVPVERDEILPSDREPTPPPVGASTLVVHLRNADDGSPVRLGYQLWLFDPAGDHECEQTVAADGTLLRFDHLVEGTYRVWCPLQRAGADDPPAFRVGPGANVATLDVRPIRKFKTRLLVLDENGSPVSCGVLRRGAGGSSSLSESRPRWVNVDRTCGGGAGDGWGEPVGRDVSAIDGFFDLDGREETSRERHSDQSFEFMAPPGTTVKVRVTSDIAQDSTFVAVVARRPDDLLANVVWPDGRPVDANSAVVETRCDPVCAAWIVSNEARRGVPLRVTVRCRGAWPLVFDWTFDGRGEKHVLVPTNAR